MIEKMQELLGLGYWITQGTEYDLVVDYIGHINHMQVLCYEKNKNSLLFHNHIRLDKDGEKELDRIIGLLEEMRFTRKLPKIKHPQYSGIPEI